MEEHDKVSPASPVLPDADLTGLADIPQFRSATISLARRVLVPFSDSKLQGRSQWVELRRVSAEPRPSLCPCSARSVWGRVPPRRSLSRGPKKR